MSREAWRDIATAPSDGTVVMLKREFEGRIVAEGRGFFGVLAAEAPSHRPMPADPLGRLKPEDYAREEAARRRFIESPKWLREGGLYLFPGPTHWRPR